MHYAVNEKQSQHAKLMVPHSTVWNENPAYFHFFFLIGTFVYQRDNGTSIVSFFYRRGDRINTIDSITTLLTDTTKLK